ncbi:hypothetical protein H8E50_00070, partial [bacterium]|nr:hypothetical protein [bacterium]
VIEGKAVDIMAIFGTGATFSDEKLCKDILMHIARNFSKELLEDRGGNIYIDYLLDKVQQLNPHQLEKVTKIIDQMLLKDVDLTTNDFHCSVKKHQ